jgi:UDP-3-O-[3-hydroxymyristoyl] N-acetylglucosamine deacetylase
MTVRVDNAQKTLRDRVTISGIGVHSGKPVSMSLCPADPDTGIVFVRTNLPGSPDVEIPAVSASVSGTQLCTILGNPAGAFVATVEHLMSALSAMGVDNLSIEIDGPEAPIMDGCSESFVDAIDQIGLEVQKAKRRFIRVVKPVRIEDGDAYAEFRPYEGRRFEAIIDYDNPVIGRQELGVDLTASTFRREVARARTFGFMSDVERLWEAGYALGSSLDNSVVIGDDGVVNPEGLRHPDEFVRHKILDAIGDLALAGAPILGVFRSYKGGHRINSVALEALLQDESAYKVVTLGEARGERHEGHAEMLPGLAAAAYAPERS